VEENNRRLCYWFYDLRFEFPQLPPSFRYGICRQEGETGWRMLRQRGLFYID
jgi:inner membrane protein